MVKITCETCREEGLLQVIHNYYRIRHYDGYKDGKPVFHYHPLTKEYVERELAKQNLTLEQLKSGQRPMRESVKSGLKELGSSKQNTDRIGSTHAIFIYPSL